MELPFTHNPNFFDKINYIKCIKSTEEQKGMCLCCMVDDTEKEQKWDRYELVCGHQYHTRCLRKYWDSKNTDKINCAYCGELDNITKNMWCNDCKEWGHDEYLCIQNKVRKMEKEEKAKLWELVKSSRIDFRVVDGKLIIDDIEDNDSDISDIDDMPDLESIGSDSDSDSDIVEEVN
jgi:hypothetical protein